MYLNHSIGVLDKVMDVSSGEFHFAAPVLRLETGMRMHLEDIYIAKTKEVIFTTRYEQTVGMMQQRMNLA